MEATPTFFRASAPEAVIYTVSRLNREARELLNEHFFKIRVEGEISNLSTPASGHIYFSLKDADAQVRCAMFRSQRRRLTFTPKNGDRVIVDAQVSLFEPRGDYQLIVAKIQNAGAGELRRAFEALKAKLAAEGLFEAQAKQPLPRLPATIGVISSPSGAAVRDILTVLKRRFPAVPVIIYGIAVQGSTAKQEIVRALQIANRRRECDVIILARGGGSLEDLWPFNEETVARAIYASELPVITGIGHEIDFTIADFAADLRTATPSAAAESATPDYREWLRKFQHHEARITQLQQKQLQHKRQLLDWLTKRLLLQHPSRQLTNKSQRLDDIELRLNQALQRKLSQCSHRLAGQSAQLWQFSPAERIRACQTHRDNLGRRLCTAIQHNLEKRQQRLARSSQTLHAISPLATLDRGYALVTRQADRKLVRSSAQLHPGDIVTTRLAKGRFTSQVQEIEDV